MSQEKNFFIQDDIYRQISQPTRQKVDTVLLTYVMRQNSIGLFTSIFCATILLISFYKSDNFTLIASWYGVFWLITIARLILIKNFLNYSVKFNSPVLWSSLFIVGAFLSGCCWGFAGAFLLPYESPIQFTLMIMILAGMTAGAVPLLAGIRSASVAFLLAALLPLSIRLMLIPDVLYVLFGISSLVYMGYLIVLTIKTYSMLASTVSLQFENDTLLQNLSITKTELELTNKKLTYAATHDFLTHLANRDLFEGRFNEALKYAKQKNQSLALFYIDIDSFKEVNDAYGHSTGDKLLQEVAKRIIEQLPENAVAARLGGDEITIVISNIVDIEVVVKLAEKICKSLAKPFEIKTFTIQISASIGVSIYPIDGDKADALLRNADNAMYYIKYKGGNNHHFNTDLATIRAAMLKSI